MTQINHPKRLQSPKSNSRGAAGPLVVSESNPRYFAVAPEATDRRVVYLTGSHINNNFHDGMGFGADCPETRNSSTTARTSRSSRHGHFIRLWRWEQFKGPWPGRTSTSA